MQPSARAVTEALHMQHPEPSSGMGELEFSEGELQGCIHMVIAITCSDNFRYVKTQHAT